MRVVSNQSFDVRQYTTDNSRQKDGKETPSTEGVQIVQVRSLS